MGRMDRNELLCEISKVSFTMDDLRLFLDTHPDCSGALKNFDKMAKERARLIGVFQENYGPMNFYNNNDCTERWRWVNAPWPWEGEC